MLVGTWGGLTPSTFTCTGFQSPHSTFKLITAVLLNYVKTVRRWFALPGLCSGRVQSR
jgi:hypothetical protein